MNRKTLNRIQGRIEALSPNKNVFWPPSLFAPHREPVDSDFCTYWKNHPDKVPLQKWGNSYMAMVPGCPFSDKPTGLGGRSMKKVTDEPQDNRSCRNCKWWKPEEK